MDTDTDTMRIAYIISTLGTGGAEKLLVDTVNHLPHCVHPDIYVLGDRMDLEPDLVHPNTTVFGLGLSGALSSWIGIGKLARIMRARRTDLIHSHMLRSNIVSRCLGRMLEGVPVINHEHGLPVARSDFQNLLDRATQEWADEIVVVSHANRRIREERGITRPEKMSVMHNAVDTIRWAGAKGDVLREDASVNWGIAARFFPQKRVDYAVRLLEAANRNGNRARLLIAGDGPEGDNLRKLVHERSLEDSVEFCGLVRDSRDFYGRIDVLLLTSEREDCPMSILEGLSSGCYIAATNVGGVAEILGEAPDAVLLDARESVEENADRIPSVVAGYVSEGNKNYSKRYDVRPYIDGLIEKYRRHLEKKQR